MQISQTLSDFINRFSLKYIKQAMERLQAMPEDPDRELTVLEKLLITDPDPKTAMVMALDMMGAGIDTVTNYMQNGPTIVVHSSHLTNVLLIFYLAQTAITHS
jgi:hypothetical protein